ncbi:carboxymuconolactone decarboxylase family protein [Parapusillimonas granuli]|uniref:Carboxymuconolactone decarboxylase family protein n=1 Tax=Parapusillimonas granuli TaxID=380911 RepID=A0A853FWL9_9BURK|nr:carboxymuconolactone decarboxylase family protein [Parapusillimonas granuli]MBB5213994.1 4-carboxymuconolactone decarboxylase [Parapusillimonas granuli]MEB2400845.1 carboxymuconolactone decarboxylase family protein [Alcaligenaceae bacterium]NYT50415.1 carboxymuconolactone decarboxylase family protein [Parapusillimonas granuli]
MTTTIPQGFGQERGERLPLPSMASMTQAQRAATDALIAGPRKGVKGPFIPLMHSPALLERLACVGEYLRFESALPTSINEFVTLLVARELSNQFEWAVHYPLAIRAGVAESTLLDVAQGARPRAMSEEEADAWAFTTELLQRHGVSDQTYAAARRRWGERGTVEMAALIGYFACVCWIMNVARTPAPEGAAALNGFPA